MPKLTLQNLFRLMSDTLSHRGDTHTVQVHSLVDPSRVWRFSTVALTVHRVRLASMLSQLPKDMLQSSGAEGLPWFEAMRHRSGTHWGGLDEADKLLAIGRAAGMVRTHSPRTDCDVPYAVILDEDVRMAERQRPEHQRNRSLLYWEFHLKQN